MKVPTKEIKLSKKYDFNGVKTDTLQMREPTIGDEIIAQESAKNPEQVQLLMFGNLCDISLDELKKVTSKDGLEIVKVYNDFLS